VPPAALVDHTHAVWGDAEAARQYMLAHDVPEEHVDGGGVYMPSGPLALRLRAIGSWASWRGLVMAGRPDWVKLAAMGVERVGSTSLDQARWRAGVPWAKGHAPW
jgi:hypothetical protein